MAISGRSARCHNQSAIRRASEGGDRAFYLAPVGSIDRPQLNPEGWRYCLDDGELANPGASGGVSNNRHPAHVRRDFLE